MNFDRRLNITSDLSTADKYLRSVKIKSSFYKYFRPIVTNPPSLERRISSPPRACLDGQCSANLSMERQGSISSHRKILRFTSYAKQDQRPSMINPLPLWQSPWWRTARLTASTFYQWRGVYIQLITRKSYLQTLKTHPSRLVKCTIHLC